MDARAREGGMGMPTCKAGSHSRVESRTALATPTEEENGSWDHHSFAGSSLIIPNNGLLADFRNFLIRKRPS